MMFLAGKQDQETLLYEFFDCSIKCITVTFFLFFFFFVVVVVVFILNR